MLADAKEGGVNIATEFGDATKHGPGVLLLREAKDLVDNVPKDGSTKSPKALAAFTRFIDQEGKLRNPEGGFRQALADRKAEGALGLGSPEAGGEDNRVSDALDPEQHLIAKQEAEEHGGGSEAAVATEQATKPSEPLRLEAPTVESKAKDTGVIGAEKTLEPKQIVRTGGRNKLVGFETKKVNVGERLKAKEAEKKLTPESKSTISESLREDEGDSETRPAGETKQPDTVTIPHKEDRGGCRGQGQPQHHFGRSAQAEFPRAGPCQVHAPRPAQARVDELTRVASMIPLCITSMIASLSMPVGTPGAQRIAGRTTSS